MFLVVSRLARRQGLLLPFDSFIHSPPLHPFWSLHMSHSNDEPLNNALPTLDASRRTVLKTGLMGATGILATGLAPAVHSADKITLRYLGTAVNQDKTIAEKFEADTGIKVQ